MTDRNRRPIAPVGPIWLTEYAGDPDPVGYIVLGKQAEKILVPAEKDWPHGTLLWFDTECQYEGGWMDAWPGELGYRVVWAVNVKGVKA